MYEKIQDMFVAARNSKVIGTWRVGTVTDRIVLADTPFLAISDSIIVYQEVVPHIDTTNELEWKESAFEKFIFALEEILKEAFKRRIFLRGGISYGEAIIRLDPQIREHIILGNPYLEAVEIEKTQSWMGIAFHPSLKEYLERTRHRSWLVEYQIPKKKDYRDLELPNITIGWVDSSLEPYRAIFDEWVTETKHHNEIKKNTLKFFNDCLERPPRIMGLEVDLRRI